jgi:hypothetical protein
MMSSEEHGKMSHATEPGKLPGVHIMKNGLESMATAIQVEMAGKKSTSKDLGQATGVHRSEWLDRLTMSMYERGEVGGKMSASMNPSQATDVHYSKGLDRLTMALFECGEGAEKKGTLTDPGQATGIHHSAILG